MTRSWSWSLVPVVAACVLIAVASWTFAQRFTYPYDLEWMEGGMLAHAWRIQHGLPLYAPPTPEWVPYIYPPGYAGLLAILGQGGLSMPLGRAVSIFGTLLACGSLYAAVRKHGGERAVAFALGASFLGVYPQTGAFLDLVRPDGLCVGLIGWALVLGLSQHRLAPAASGALVFLAFLAKHNAAAFGAPLILTFWWRDGPKAAAWFAATSVIPALIAIGWLQSSTDGAFLTYLLKVPASHPIGLERIWPGTFKEVGTALPAGLAAIGAVSLWHANLPTSRVPRAVSTFGPVLLGMLLGAIGTYEEIGPDGLMSNEGAGVAIFVITTLPLCVGLWAYGRPRGEPVPWQIVYAVSLAAVAFPLAAWMRAHNGGFLNVQIPLYYTVAFGFGGALVWIERTFARGKHAGYALLTAQIVWSTARFEPTRFVPTPADRAAGDRFVAAAKAVDGPVLSPWAAWLPVYAGKEPSLHYMGLWDLEYPTGPYLQDTEIVRQAVRDQHWALVFAGNERFPYALLDSYELQEQVLVEANAALMPKTGYRVRPERILAPKTARPARPQKKAAPEVPEEELSPVETAH